MLCTVDGITFFLLKMDSLPLVIVPVYIVTPGLIKNVPQFLHNILTHNFSRYTDQIVHVLKGALILVILISMQLTHGYHLGYSHIYYS